MQFTSGIQPLLFAFALCFAGFGSTELQAQTVQLPTFSFFNVNTTVKVPDGGQMYLGGVGSTRAGSISRGLPGASSLPLANRLFRNQAIGASTIGSGTSVSAKIIIMSEIEEEVMAEANRRIASKRALDPNGSREVQNRAAFIARNIGRMHRR